MSEKSGIIMLSPQSKALESFENVQEESEKSPKSIERTMNFSDSESDLEKENKDTDDNIISPSKSKDIAYGRSSSLDGTKKSRIKHIDTSESENSSSEDKITEKKSIRVEDKMKKLKDKFKGLISNHVKSSQEIETHSDEKLPNTDDENSNNFDDVSCLKIKQKIKKSAYSMNSICDPDTSDEESSRTPVHKKKYKQLKPRSTKPTSPKPMRMSAKQAMENMHKIKSESNRMLREKQVSLPYHRPKALSLKDIMSRRKPAVTSDGKALPIKMNNEQLTQYALLLEQRQKEVIELCKSDTEEDEEEEGSAGDSNDKNDISLSNVVTEPSLGATNIEQTVDGDNHNANEKSSVETEAQEINVNSDIENIVNENSDVENIRNSDVENIRNSDVEKQASIETKSSKETETFNEPANIDVDEEFNETDANSNPKNDKGDIINVTDAKSNPKCDKDVIISEDLSKNPLVKVPEPNTERDSQNMELHYDSEKVELIQESEQNKSEDIDSETPTASTEKHQNETLLSDNDEFLDSEFNCDEIDRLIENAKIASDGPQKSFSHPKLTGAPGMVIDLDNTDPLAPKQLTGVDLLKERFTYFAKLKSLEDMEKDREKKFKPGIQHLKLKQELEEQIAEQRSIEWEKRLEEEKRLKSEIDGHFSDDDIEKLEAKLEESDEKLDGEKVDNESSEGEEEPIEDDIILEDKPKKRNPMVDDEAEESDCDEEFVDENDEQDIKINSSDPNADDGDEADLEDDDDETSDSSSESAEECQSKPRKGRILKAFEDSDDESVVVEDTFKNKELNTEITENNPSKNLQDNETTKDSQDDELQLAQANKSSEDLFSTQESDKPNLVVAALTKNNEDNTSADLGTQTFSILDSLGANQTLDLNAHEKTSVCRTQTLNDDLNILGGVCPDISYNLAKIQNNTPHFSQTQEIGDDVVALCTGKFYDNPFVPIDAPINCNSQVKLLESSQSQEFGDDVAALCTGKFYDNPFVSQHGSDINKSETLEITQKLKEVMNNRDLVNPNDEKKQDLNSENVEKTILNSILEELDGPDLEESKNKYFASDTQSDKTNIGYSQIKKKLVIDSDDETNDGASQKKNKKLRKRKAEERALQISDDEEEELAEEDESDIESEINEDEERIVEYDSEENEVEVKQKTSEKKRIGAFFENEAELTSEDEWVGSGDEDERGLDRMEREEGDDETFHQGQLQRELGQIHMREVLDQDKREVRMIQELLFEDGDLGDGHRQRKFRWRNADGEEELGTNPDEFLDTQEEEFESEEQWRKQRHEREMFLRKLQEKDGENLDTAINRTAIIKANLCSRSMSMLLSECKGNKTDKDDTLVTEKKPAKDIPSPKKSFTIFQQNYHGSLLTRGRGALARLAALATPLATDNDDAPKVVTTVNRRNFVFAALSQDEKQKQNYHGSLLTRGRGALTRLAALATPLATDSDDAPKVVTTVNRRNFVFAALSQDEKQKVTKRKADTNLNTPRLIKKMKAEDPNKQYKSTLFDHLKS